MSRVSDFALTVLSSAGVTAALLAIVAWLLRTWISERLSAQVRHQYDKRLAELNASLRQQGDAAASRLKADLDRLGDRVRLTAQSFGEVQKATIERRITAVEEVWAAVLETQEALPPVFTVFDVLLDSEYSSTLTNPKTASDIQAIDHYKIISPVLASGQRVYLRRPFIGNFLWAVFSTYRAVLFRMIYLVEESVRKPEKIHWYSDELIRKHIRAGLGDEAIAQFDALRISRISWVRDQFYRAILDAMDGVIAGRDASEAALRQAERMEELLVAAKDAR